MNMKKIMASVAASALAVSAMATAAFADVSKDYFSNKEEYYGTVTITAVGVWDDDNSDGNFDMTVKVPAANLGTGGYEQFTEGSVTIEYSTADGVKSYTNSDKLFADTKAYALTTGTFGNMPGLEDGADYKVTFTYGAKKYDAKYDKDNVGAYELLVEGATANPTSAVEAGETKKIEATTLTFNSAEFKVAEREEIKNAESVTLTLTFKAEEAEDTVLTLTDAEDKEIAKKTLAKGDTSATFELAVEDFYSVDYDAFETVVLNFELEAADQSYRAIDKATLTFVAPAAEGTEASDETDATEDTEASLEGDETTDPDGEVNGDGDADASGDAGADGDADADGKGENPGTGVALAIVPAIVAGAAVVASRKRK